MDALEQDGGGFVGAAFAAGEFGFGGDEFSAEGFGQDGLCQFVRAFRCGGHVFFNGVRELEEGFDAADDFVLFFEGREWYSPSSPPPFALQQLQRQADRFWLKNSSTRRS